MLFAGPAGDPDGIVDDASVYREARAALASKSLSFGDFLRDEKLVLRADLLRPWANWVTPEGGAHAPLRHLLLRRRAAGGPAGRRRQHRNRPGGLDHPAGGARRLRRGPLVPAAADVDAAGLAERPHRRRGARRRPQDRRVEPHLTRTPTRQLGDRVLQQRPLQRRAQPSRAAGLQPRHTAGMNEFVSVHVSDEQPGVGTLLLSRPPTNALTRQMYRELSRARRPTSAGATTSPPSSCSAATRSSRRATTCRNCARSNARGGGDGDAGLPDAVDAVAAIPKPTVAAITGYALGSGLTLALAADWRVSGDNVKVRARRRSWPAWCPPAVTRAAGPRGRGEQGQGPGVQRPVRRRQGGAGAWA